ncbi:MAG: VanW family protein [Microgenomates group bacterium GW2011_GWA2_37_6]|nr:MAG: VanW family protein [Microgenomates group bacterium GW2011_GWA2_37_6]
MRSSLKKIRKKHVKHVARVLFWFSIGGFLAFFLVSSFSYFAFQEYHKGKVYPGVRVGGVNFGEKSEAEISNYFLQKNLEAGDATFIFNFENYSATVSAKDIEFGYDDKLLADQAMSLGRAQGPLSNISMILQAYTNGVNLSPSYKFSEAKLEENLKPTIEKIEKKPVEALFNFEGGKVKEFRISVDGRQVNKEELNQLIISKARLVINSTNQKVIIITIPVKVVKPTLTTESVNKMGIKELIGTGTSLFQHSIESRIYNVDLAASRLNGALVAPGETFSFAKAIGDISSFTGYKQAYIIQNGKTVLGDGGGVCQVSTTLFRAALIAGLPIEERTAHAYRVSYYEQDSPPGIDATVYVPTVDLKFRNDTPNHILIQTVVDLNELRLTFNLYGTKDGRISEISTPVITNQTPAPEARYEDDPTLQKGVVKQVDFAAAGAKVYFTRTVTKNGKVIIFDKFTSNYRPWQAVYLRGTKE